MKNTVTKTQVTHVAQLASLTITEQEAEHLVGAFDETLAVIDNLSQLSLNETEPTSQVTGLENITRADEVLTDNMFSQQEALANAKRSYDGYFVVDRIIDND
ncbi:MAG: Asp-tRNA(Asn)/Glu-tRNA(Gln) amidotransferase GatCAB subunit C [Candidatus Pacebacteria bacterium CG_4_10_14_0_8_um_filter_43_12]|nr:MAG: Asp-tRNA(Asn)/Glu-tRNA(Gln) amidotransferase GatCAB subunit C [Candidatus Pacebacteria bacterium CG10_big_fil_rev_8_21_14_0_10_44_11]PIY79339.1 MAG: Asp-tRNA(Asn)/Glu-tRNA(Gln) amidotransferase GatCAB subunit C [Candidatus Pacebacteria bacterium CG_4_10_14_0_8_um_filter_43_12]